MENVKALYNFFAQSQNPPDWMEDSSSENTAIIESSDSDIPRPRRRRDRSSEVPISPSEDQSILKDRTKQQRFLFLGQVAILFIHVLVTIMLAGWQSDAAFLLAFHGVISPLAPMLYVIGVISTLYGYLSVYRKEKSNIPMEARARWFRRYMRWNKNFLFTWILSSLGSVFGCWQFVFIQSIDDVLQREQLVTDHHIMSIIRLLIINLPGVLRSVTRDFGITAKTRPLDFVGLVGEYYYVFFFLATLFPASFLYFSMRRQRHFYTIYFAKHV